MAEKSKKTEDKNIVGAQVQDREIVQEMEESYLAYAMSVIVSRALPDVRDGLKPVHRRILYAMNEMGLRPGAKVVKSAKIVGQTMSALHPHGDIAIYDSLVRMAQNFSLRYPFVHGQGNWGCFTGDTNVLLTDGRELSFVDLVKEHKEGKKNYTYTFNKKTGSIEIAEIQSPRLTKNNSRLVEVVLDDGSKIRCTPDHKFMLRNGNYKEAEYLTEGESLMPVYLRLSTVKDDKHAVGYKMIWQPIKNIWDWAHRLADNFNLTIGKYKNSAGRVRHHIDFNKLNNNPNNIQRMQWADHWKLHYQLASKRHRDDPEYVTKLKKGRENYWAKPENREKSAKFLSERNREWWKNPEYKKKRTATVKKLWSNKEYKEIISQAKVYNHKVVEVKFLEEKADVYDLTIDETHNFALAAGIFVHNSLDGDSAAAMRYTEARLSSIAEPLLADIDKDTVDFADNYDNTTKEPLVLPTKIPSLLINGSMGIAVGMATSIPPHNLTEVLDGLVHLVDNPEADVIDLNQFVKGPDFPTAGIIYNEKDILNAYATGKGPIIMRAKTDIVEGKKGFQIIVTEIPYQVNKAELIKKIAELAMGKERKVEGIKDVRDESDREGVRVVVDLKQDAFPKKVLNQLFKYTELQKTFHINMLALVDGIQPQILGLKGVLEHFIEHRRVVVIRRAKFDLKKAQDRAHILEGLKKALDHIDAIIKLIRASASQEEALKNLMKKFSFSQLQATAILEMKLRALAGLERKKVEDELAEKKKLIAELEALLASPKKILALVKQEFLEIKEKYGDERRTKIIKSALKEIGEEELVPEKDSLFMITRGGYLKRMAPDILKVQKRGGKGLIGIETKEEDVVTQFFMANTHDTILFFTNSGRAFQAKGYEVPESSRTSKGKAIVNFLNISSSESVTAVVPLSKDRQRMYLFMATKNGVVKKVALSDFQKVRSNGLAAIKLKKDDELIWVKGTSGKDEIVMVSSDGNSIRFKESDVRAMGRVASGVIGMRRLEKEAKIVGMEVVSADVPEKDFKLLVVMDKGYGKRTDLRYYKVQHRGGRGIMTAKLTSKTGRIISAHLVNPEEKEIIAVSQKGQVIRTELGSISVLGRATQGVRIMRMAAGDSVASVVVV